MHGLCCSDHVPPHAQAFTTRAAMQRWHSLAQVAAALNALFWKCECGHVSGGDDDGDEGHERRRN